MPLVYGARVLWHRLQDAGELCQGPRQLWRLGLPGAPVFRTGPLIHGVAFEKLSRTCVHTVFLSHEAKDSSPTRLRVVTTNARFVAFLGTLARPFQQVWLPGNNL